MKHLILITIALATIFTGCKKDIYGCTDSQAKNYDINANVNNNTCVYTGTVVFWQNTDQGKLTVTIDNQTKYTTVYYPKGLPECSNNSCATFELTPGIYSYTVTNFQYQWTGNLKVDNNICSKQLIY